MSPEEQKRNLWKERYYELLDKYQKLKEKADKGILPESAFKKYLNGGGKKMIYILQHPIPGFTGNFGAVDFHNGIGSTSCVQDRDKLVQELGFKDITEEYFKEREKKNKRMT